MQLPLHVSVGTIHRAHLLIRRKKSLPLQRGWVVVCEGVPLLQKCACTAEGVYHAVGYSYGEIAKSGVSYGCC